jgi:MFS family permease
MDVENIIKNSKTLKQLTKDISAIAKNQGGGSGGATGINRVDDKIDDIKNSIANNTTVQFFKDPAGSISKGISGVIKPFADIPGTLMDGFKKLNPFGLEGVPVKKALSNLEKASKEQTRILKSIDKTSQSTGDEIGQGLSEALGTSVIRDELTKIRQNGGVLAEGTNQISNLKTQLALLPDAIQGKLFAGPALKLQAAILQKKDMLVEGIRRKFNLKQKDQEEKTTRQEFLKLDNLVEYYGKTSNEDVKIRMRQAQEHFEVLRPILTETAVGIRDSRHILGSIQNHIARLTNLGEQEFSEERKQQKIFNNQDQSLAEAERDKELKTQERHEQLITALSGITGDSAGKDETSKKAGGIFDWIKKNFMGIGGGLVAGATAVTGGISGLFLGMINTLTEGFRILGRRRVMVTRGAGVLALMGLSLLPFAGSLFAINKALGGLTMKKVGVFGAMLTTLGVAIAGFSLAISTGVGGAVVAGAIGLLALLGTALIPFGKALEIAGGGLEPAADLFTALTNIKWSSFFLAGPALTALASSLQSFKGLPEITKGDDSALDQISQMGAKIASTLPGAATPLKDFETAIGGLADLEIGMGIGNGLQNIYEATDKRDFKSRLENAGQGLKSLLSDINSELNNLNQDALNKVSALLSGDSTALTAMNTSGFDINAGSIATGMGSGQPIVVVDNSTGGSNQNINVTQQVIPHTNDSTLQLLAT